MEKYIAKYGTAYHEIVYTSGISRLVRLPGHLVGPVTQEFETPIPSQPNEKNLLLL